jgi:protein-disulfide isomerase
VNTSEPPTITLTIERPGEPVETHTFRGTKALIGRETGEIVLRDAESSALHAELDCTQGHIVVRDLGSSNGTWRRKVAVDGTESWERLPQFALLRAGAFRCGATIIRLVSIEGEGEITIAAAGRTVVSGKRDDAAPRPSVPTAPLPPTMSGVTALRVSGGPPPPSGAPTLPGAVDRTIVGQAPTPSAPTLTPTPTPAVEASTPTLPTASSSTVVAPAPTPPVPELPTSDAGSTMRGPTQHHTDLAPVAAAAAAAAPPAPPPAAAQPAFRPPVANALIRPGSRPITGPSAVVTGPKQRSWLRFAGLGALILAGVGLVGGAIWWAVRTFTGGPPALAVTIAKELPDDTLGFVAFASPRTQLDMLGDSVPEPLRKEAADGLGFDPFTTAGWEGIGIDPTGEIGIALLDVAKPTIAVSFGLGDTAKLRTGLPGVAAKLGRISEPKFSDRSFGEVSALWLEEPVPAAILLRDRRAMAIVGLPGSDASTVARHAERLATLDPGATLAKREGFRALGDEPGKPLLVAYVDGVSLRSAVPASAPALLAVRTGFGEIDAMAFTLASDGPRIHAAWQTVIAENAKSLEYIGDVERTGRAMTRIPGPALAASDAAFAPEPIIQTLTAFATLAGVMGPAETEFRAATNLDLRTDVIDNVGGEIGGALLRLPSKPKAVDFSAVLFASVKDGKKADTSLSTALAALQQHVFEVPATTEKLGDVAVHTFAIPIGPEPLRVSLFVAADHLWMAFGTADVRAIIDASGKSIRDTARNDAIREAATPGDTAAGFFDIRDSIAAADPLLSEGDRAELALAKPITAPLEVITFRASTKGRVARFVTTLHTSADDALPTLVRAAFQVAGESFVKAVGRERRQAGCDAHIEKLEAIAKTDTSRTLPEYSLRFDVRDACTTKANDEQLACAAKAATFADIEACGGADAGLLPPEPEPQAVPYVEDIWPNTRSSPSDGAQPRPDVNYGVEVGPDPQTRGRADALVTIIEFGDFQCPYCREVTSTIDDLLTRHGDDVRVVFRHNPLAIHPEAKSAAKAALAAGRQGKFWAMHDKLFESQFELSPAKYREYAIAIGLDATKFDTDFADPELDRRIEEDLGIAKRFGVTGTPAFFVNGRFLSGNQPAGVFDRVINEELSRARTFVERRGNTRKRLYDDMVTRWATEVSRASAIALPPDSGERFNFDTTGMASKGATGFARVKLVECGDFECPYCQRATKTLQRVLADYPTQVTFFFAHNPLSFHARAEPAARAAVAAEIQGKFFEMHDKIFGDTESLGDEQFVLYAKELKLDVDKFKADFASAEVAKKVSDQKKICADNGGSSTPTFFLNGRRIEGAQPYETFKALIDAELVGGI